MNAEDRITNRNLTESRRRLAAIGALRPELTAPDRERRVAEYARQVAAYGGIVEWLPPGEVRTVYRSRFDDGDILRPRRA